MTPRISRRTLALPLLALALPARAQPAGSPGGSLGGVVGELDRGTAPISLQLTRSMRPELLEMVPARDPGTEPFPGRLAAWLDRPDQRYVVGDTAQIGVESSVAAHVQILGVGAEGKPVWLFPPDSLPSNVPGVPQDPAALPADAPLIFPRPGIDRFVLRLREPRGAALAFIIATTEPFTRAMRDRLLARMEAAPDTATANQTLTRELAAIAQENPALRMKHLGLPYVTEAASAGASAAPSGPALDWVRPTAPAGAGLAVMLDRRAYLAGERMTLRLRAEQACQITVLALGQGGMIDVLYPNLRQRSILSASQELMLPPAGIDLRLRLRGPRGPVAEQERILVVAGPTDEAPLVALPSGHDMPTMTLAPGHAFAQAMVEALRRPNDARTIVEVTYRVQPSEPPSGARSQ